jgi:hypothetical protein
VKGFLEVNEVRAPKEVIADTQAHLREVGRKGLEGVALWAGKHTAGIFTVERAIIPSQKAFRTEQGLLYTVGPEELHRINVWLYENQMTLIAQIHSHPGAAYHSETDDSYPIVTTVGALSLVVPDFARAPFELENCAVYRLFSGRGWVELSTTEAEQLIQIGGLK